MMSTALSSSLTSSWSRTKFICLLISFSEIDLNSNLWVLDSIVSGIFSISVVAKINIRCFGGSSIIFKRALKPSLVIMWASSIIYTLYFKLLGGYMTWSLNCLISSILLFEAASISTISMVLSSKIDRQFAHSLHGFPSIGFRQLTAFEKIFAVEVFPVPRPPENI